MRAAHAPLWVGQSGVPPIPRSRQIRRWRKPGSLREHRCDARASPAMEPISPELCLVDPALALEARARLPDVVLAGPKTREIAPATRIPVRDRIVRAGAWLLVPSVVLNVALLGSHDSARTDAVRPPATASPAVPHSTPPASVRPAAKPRRPAPSTYGVLGAAATPKHPPVRRSAPARRPRKARAPAAQRTLDWPVTPGARSYDLVLWRGHRRVADLWPKKPGIAVDTVACSAGRRLSKGRYLWFVYPVVGTGSHRYGALARSGVVDVNPAVCSDS
jgi:hypothetical protein